MQPLLILMLLALLTLANGAPVIAKKVFGGALSQPLDGGASFIDGRPLFGTSKTVRGVLVSIVATSLGAPVLGLEFSIGAIIGTMAMVGDLFSSFVKRRLNLSPGSRATGLDQIPESLFPLLACRVSLGLSLIDIAIGVAAFFVGAVLLSRVFYRLGLRDLPY
jgi:CDP-2,3-bis-(O-geranylgeranyl)-sn-glycerol synthase